MKTSRVVLTIAGSDPSSGAGVQADLKTFWHHKVHGLSVITCITSQNSCGVYGVYELPKEVVCSQLRAILEDFKVDVVKIGMVFSEDVISRVSNLLKEYNITKIILDPIIKSSSGYNLIKKESISSIKQKLFSIAYLVTPNVSEASFFSDIEITDENDVFDSAKKIYSFGAKNILIKGGHLDNKNMSIDYLFDGRSFYQFKSDRILDKDVHGTGCMFSSAIAANLAKGYDLIKSINQAKEFVNRAIKSSIKIGKGFYIWT